MSNENDIIQFVLTHFVLYVAKTRITKKWHFMSTFDKLLWSDNNHWFHCFTLINLTVHTMPLRVYRNRFQNLFEKFESRFRIFYPLFFIFPFQVYDLHDKPLFAIDKDMVTLLEIFLIEELQQILNATQKAYSLISNHP